MHHDFEPIAAFAYSAEAQLAAGRLGAEGIDTRIEERGVLGVSWLNPGHSGGIVLLVRPEDAEIARVLLEEIEDEFEPEVPGEYAAQAEGLQCPECGSTNKKFLRESRAAFLIRLSGAHREFKGHRWKCRDCDHIWRVEPTTNL